MTRCYSTITPESGEAIRCVHEDFHRRPHGNGEYRWDRDGNLWRSDVKIEGLTLHEEASVERIDRMLQEGPKEEPKVGRGTRGDNFA